MEPQIRIQFPDPECAKGTLIIIDVEKNFPCLAHVGWNYPMECIVTAHNKHPHNNNAPHTEDTIALLSTQQPQQTQQPQHNALRQRKYCIGLDQGRGVYLHAGTTGPEGTLTNKEAGEGCIELAEEDARAVYDYIQCRTKISITHPWSFGLVDTPASI